MRTGKRRVGMVLVAAVLGVGVGACGSDSKSGSSSAGGSNGTGSDAAASVAQFEAAAKKAMEPTAEWIGPTEGPKAVGGKRIMFLSCSFAADGCKRPADAAKAAGKALGWDVNVVDGKFDQRVWNQAIQQAVDQKVDGIILDAIAVEAVSGAVERARKAGIPVGSFDGFNEQSDTGVVYDIRSDYRAQGRSLANYAAWKGGGKATAYLLNAPEFKVCVEQIVGAQEAFEECPTCEIVKKDDFTGAEGPTRVPQLISSALAQHPNITTIIAPYDAALLNAVPNLPESEKVTVGAYNGIKAWLQLIRDGKVAATSAEAKEWGTYAAFDNLNRVFAGQEPIEQKLPIRLITKENIDEIPEGQAWTGDVDYASHFAEIWSDSAA